MVRLHRIFKPSACQSKPQKYMHALTGSIRFHTIGRAVDQLETGHEDIVPSLMADDQKRSFLLRL